MDNNYTELAVKIEKVDSRSRANENSINDFKVDLQKTKDLQIAIIKIANSVENLGKSMVGLDGKVDVLTNKVTEIENRPANETKKRWDNIRDKLIWLFVGGIAVGILSQILPNIPW